MAVTGRAVFLAFVGVLVVFIAAPAGNWVLWATLGLILAVLLVDLALAANSRAVRFERSGDTSIRLGESAAVSLVVANPGPRVLRATVRDAWRPSAAAAPRTHEVVVPAGGRRRVGTTLTPVRRGDQHSAQVTVRSYGPLGLAARQSSHAVPWSVRTLPPFNSRRHLPGKLSRLRELEGQHRAMIRGQGSEFDSLREYVPGDDVRSIDWRATARRETVVVRTWRPERDRRILVVLDTSRTSAGRVGDVPRLEHAMDAGLLLTALAAKAGDRVELLAYDRRVRARVRAHGRGSTLQAIVSAMTPLEPELVESDSAGLVAAILGGQSRSRQLVVLLTDLNAAAMEEGLLPRLSALTARHLVLVAAVGDPRVAEMAAERGDARAAYNAAAAQKTIADRRRITAELRRHGVEVVDAGPDDIAPALADAYISLKAQGRL
ncbi:DUF58 domain-containing protein [Actinorugispora endophytica]|uniref:Uncharacterized protein (DUF58 family) n=1 Tax=Actinorugispora endophytica TaxID=1605990 RepID=A0A4R6V1Q3_9ACTN|nr:DUF58 domain-containing protein [Actinorugispora endophytica]TDQ51955.1 uncharacterized protein (DUF58 family) [Actinorugispora endophytica]